MLATCGYDPVRDAPLIPEFELNRAEDLAIIHGPQGPVLTLRLKAPLTQDLMLFGSPPCNPGRASSNEYEFLDVVPPGESREIDITQAYVWKHSAPPPGSHVFIRVWPQQDGWEARGLMSIVSAIVPPKAPKRPSR